MVYFFRSPEGQIIAVDSQTAFSAETADTLTWLFSGAELLQDTTVTGTFIGPRREMITPWSTAAVEITQNMNITGIARIEEFFPVPEGRYASDTEIPHDKMLQRIYHGLDGDIFVIDRQPEPIRHITDFEAYNKESSISRTSPPSSADLLPTARYSASPRSIRNTAATRYSTAPSSSTEWRWKVPSSS